MIRRHTVERHGSRALAARVVAVALALAWALPVGATPQLNELHELVGIDQQLGTKVPTDLTFRDERGESVSLSRYVGQRPVVLMLVYYECPMLCQLSFQGLIRGLKPLSFTPGLDFDIVAVSIDPDETPALAAKKKQHLLETYRRVGADMHFLTGEEAQIRRLASSVGFRYYYDPKTDEYAHGAALIVLTKGGKVSRYIFGTDYAPRDLDLALVEASEGKLGTLSTSALLLCYAYDQASGRYTLSVMRILRLAGGLTVFGLATALYLLIRRGSELQALGQPESDGDPESPEVTA